MKTINEIIEFVENRIKGTEVPQHISNFRYGNVVKELNQELKSIGIKILIDDEDSRSLMLDINSKEYPQTKMRRNETTYKQGKKVLLRRKVTYEPTMFSKRANEYVWKSIDRLNNDIEIDDFLAHCKQVNLKLQKFIKSKKQAKAQCSKLGLGWDFERLGVYTLQRIFNLAEKGKKDVLIDILETLNNNFTMDTILK